MSTTLPERGCQMVCFKTKNPNLGKFWRALQWKMLVYFNDTWSILHMLFCYILWTFGVVRGILVYFSRFGILYQEKSGNPVPEANFNNMSFPLWG
jgi:hypothetical protein